jgi:hypothetical protein
LLLIVANWDSYPSFRTSTAYILLLSRSTIIPCKKF